MVASGAAPCRALSVTIETPFDGDASERRQIVDGLWTASHLVAVLQEEGRLAAGNSDALLTVLLQKEGTGKTIQLLPSPTASAIKRGAVHTLIDAGLADGDSIVILSDIVGGPAAPSPPKENSLVSLVDADEPLAASPVSREQRPVLPAEGVDEGEAAQGRKESLLHRFKSAASKTLRKSTMVPGEEAHAEPLLGSHRGRLGLLFGVALDLAAELGAPTMSAVYGVPSFIEDALSFVIRHESRTEGIFRLSGSLSQMREYRARLDLGERIDWEAGDGGRAVDGHCVCGLVKMYLRELPEPLLTFTLFEAFCNAAASPDAALALGAVSSLLHALPIANYNLLRFIVTSLCTISTFEGDTRMGTGNLATLIGPNIGWSRAVAEGRDQQRMFIETCRAAAVASYLMRQAGELFGGRRPAHVAVARAIFDYEPAEGDELALCQGAIVYVHEADDRDGWWAGSVLGSGGRLSFGRFPHNYVMVLSASGAGGRGASDERLQVVPGRGGAPGADGRIVQNEAEGNSPRGAGDGTIVEDANCIPTSDHKASFSGDRGCNSVSNCNDPSASDCSESPAKSESGDADSFGDGANVFGDGPFSDGALLDGISRDDIPRDGISRDGISKDDIPRDSIPKVDDSATRLFDLEEKVWRLQQELAEERRQRERLTEMIPRLMSNQDRVLALLDKL